MNNIWEHLARGLAAVGGFIAGLYGGWSGAMTVLVIFMVADYVLGCACALTGRSTKTPGGGFLSSVCRQPAPRISIRRPAGLHRFPCRECR